MIAIRFHGRGGQGAVTSAELLALAAIGEGKYAQAFPSFGPERRGAPVEAYLRLDDKEILVRSHVYTPDHVVVLDRTLLQVVDVVQGLKAGGWVLINAPAPPADFEPFSGFHLAFVDATRLALHHQLGTRTHPIVNTAVLGAFARVLGMPPLEAVVRAIEEDVPGKPAENIQAAQEAYQEVRIALEGKP